MRDYSKVSAAFWTGKTGKALRGDLQTQVVAMYLLTCRHATMIGVFSCPLIYIAHETGSPIEGASKALRRLSELDFCTFDEENELMWVHEMARYQIADALKLTDKRVKDVQKQVEALPEGEIKQQFIDRYRDAYHLAGMGQNSKPLRSPLEAPSKPVTETGAVTEAEAVNPPASKKPTRGAPENADDFDRFWSIWPKKVEKQKAEKAWAKLKPETELVARIIAAVVQQQGSDAWRKGNGQFIPHPATWLNGRRWEDELAPVMLGYSDAEIEVMTAYNATLAERDWPRAVADPFSADRASAVREFLGFGSKAGWIEAYFGWLAEHLPAKEGFGFDWAIQRTTFLRAKEGNFAALREAA